MSLPAARRLLAKATGSPERVTSQTDPLGRVTTFTYGPNAGANLVQGQTLVTDPAGHKTIDTYDDRS